MDCDQARQIMLDALTGALPAPESESLERHMAECDDCSAEYHAVGAGLHALRDVRVELCGGEAERAVPRVLAPPLWQQPRWGVRFALAAGLLVMIGAYLGIGAWLRRRNPSPPTGPTVAVETRRVPVPVFISRATSPDARSGYDVFVPRNVDFSPDEWEQVRNSASRIIQSAGGTLARTPEFRRYPLPMVVPVREEP
jgi:anti-sigma factor RsiW